MGERKDYLTTKSSCFFALILEVLGQSGNPDMGNGKGKLEIPLCLWKTHAENGWRHYMKNCKQCPPEEKIKLLKERSEQIRKNSPASNARSQTDGKTADGKTAPSPGKSITDRVAHLTKNPSCDQSLWLTTLPNCLAKEGVMMEVMTPLYHLDCRKSFITRNREDVKNQTNYSSGSY